MLRPKLARPCLFAGVAALAFMGLARPGAAAEITAEKWPEDPVALILIAGPVEEGDGRLFAEVAAPYVGTPAMVVLQSSGGSVPAAMEIGMQIREASFATIVLEGDACRAACALIWLAGIQRHLGASSDIAISGSTGPRAEAAALASGPVAALLEGYLGELDLPQPMIRYVLEAEGIEAGRITPGVARRLGVNVWEYRDGEVISPDEEPAVAGGW